MNYEQKSNELLNLLSRLADNQEYSRNDIEQDIDLLTKIYSGEFRHRYTKISAKVAAILEEDIHKGESLAQNLEAIKAVFEERIDKNKVSFDLYNKVCKLCDHVNLEIGRYNLIINKIDSKMKNILAVQQNSGASAGRIDQLDERISKIENQVTGAVNKTYEVTKELGKVDGKLERNSMSSITTLTIFSAVILAFTGSITFTAGVFKGMADVSPYRIVFVTSIIGVIIFNLIFMLLYIVSRMVGKSIGCRCAYYAELADEDAIGICGSGICKKRRYIPNIGCIILHKYPYILFVNAILGLIMYYDMLLFFINHSEYLPFVNIANVNIIVMLVLPIFSVFVGGVISRMKRQVLYSRTINALSLAIVEEYFEDKNDGIMAGVLNKLTESIRQIFYSNQGNKKAIEIILENITGSSDNERYKCFAKELQDYCNSEIIKGNENLMRISFTENYYNKKILKKRMKEILQKETYRNDMVIDA